MHLPKICFVAIGVYPLFHPSHPYTFGGAEVQLYLLGKKISEKKYAKVSYVVGNFGQEFVEKRDGIHLYRGIEPVQSDFFLSKILKAWKLFWILRRVDSDIYVQRSASMGTGLISLYCKLFKKKFIYMTAHEIDCDGQFERQESFIVGKIYRFGLKNATRVITQNKEHQELLKRFYNIDAIVLNSAYEINDKLAVKGKMILWVGRAEEWKRPEVFIRLAKNFPQYSFVMIAPPANKTAVFEQIKSRAVGVQNLQFIPKVPFDKIDHFFATAKIFVNTSYYEGFPNTFVQAAKNRTPILSLKVNPDNVISVHRLGFCADDNEARLGELVQYMMQDESLWKECSENAFQYAKRNHDIELIVKKYRDVFNSLYSS